MKVVQIVRPGKIELANLEPRLLKPGEVRIAVAAVAICGSDLKVIDAPITIPLVPGHEFSGVIIEVSTGSKDCLHFGDKVTVYPMISCMACDYCLKNKFRDCESKLSLGFQLPGAFSDEIVVDSRFVIHLMDGLTYEQGALVEHLCCGYRLAMEIVSYQLPLDSHIVLIGDGPIALADLQILRLFNYSNITVIGKYSLRLELAQKLGANQIINFKDRALTNIISNSSIVDICVFAAPADDTLTKIIPFIRPQGILFPQTRIRGSSTLELLENSNISSGRAFAYEFDDFNIVMNLIKKGEIRTDILVSQRVTLSEVPRIISNMNGNKLESKTLIINENFEMVVNNYRRSTI